MKKVHSVKLLPSSIKDQRSIAFMGALDDALKISDQKLNLIDFDHVDASLLDHFIKDYDLTEFLTSDAPDIVKRRLLKNAKKIKAQLGFRPAIETGLEALGVKVDIVEWWQKQPNAERGTFEVIAWVNEQVYGSDILITNELKIAIEQMINTTKRFSQHHQFKVGTQHNSNLLVRCAAQGATFQEFTGATYVPEYQNNISIATIAQSAVFAEFNGATL